MNNLIHFGKYTFPVEGRYLNSRWPKYTFFGLGGLMALLFFIYTLVSLKQTPSSANFLSKYAGIYHTDTSIVVPLFLSLVAVYIIVYFYFRSTAISSRRMINIVLFSLLFSVLLLISTPFLSTDLYGYIFRAEIANVHHVNPYHVAPKELGYAGIVPFSGGVMPYGPMYTVYSMLLQKISGPILAVKMTIFRLANLMLFFLCAWLFYQIAKRTVPDQARSSTALFLWNPFILVELINNGHNDVLILLSILFSILLLLRNKYIIAGLALVLGFLIKFITIFLIPLVFLWILYGRQSKQKKVIQLVGLILAAAALVAVMYLPFSYFSDNLSGLGQSYFYAHKTTFPVAVVKAVINFIGNTFTNFSLSTDSLLNIMIGLFIFFYSTALFYRRKLFTKTLVQRYFWILLITLSLVPVIFNIWYTIWLMPLVLLITDKRYHILILFFTLSGFVFYFDGLFLANTLFFILLIIYYSALKSWPFLEKYWQ
jgi:hypothetical protein